MDSYADMVKVIDEKKVNLKTVKFNLGQTDQRIVSKDFRQTQKNCYPVDSTIQLSNNRHQVAYVDRAIHWTVNLS